MIIYLYSTYCGADLLKMRSCFAAFIQLRVFGWMSGQVYEFPAGVLVSGFDNTRPMLLITVMTRLQDGEEQEPERAHQARNIRSPLMETLRNSSKRQAMTYFVVRSFIFVSGVYSVSRNSPARGPFMANLSSGLFFTVYLFNNHTS